MVSPAFESTLQDPHAEILRIYQKCMNDGTVDDLEKQVETHFKTVTENRIHDIPCLEQGPPLRSLVRFRCMIQDSGVGSELYMPVVDSDKPSATKKLGLWSDAKEVSHDALINNSEHEIRERQVLFTTNIPGQMPHTDCYNIPKVSSSTIHRPKSLDNRFPLKTANNLSCVVKVYDMEKPFKPTELWEFVGILDESRLSSDLETFAAEQDDKQEANSELATSLHVLFGQPISRSTLVPKSNDCKLDIKTIRSSLISYISKHVLNDKWAAEWLLLHFISQVYSRRGGKPIGSFPLNLSFKQSDLEHDIKLNSLLQNLSPMYHQVSLDISSLNDSNTKFYPESKDEQLYSGLLQLPAGHQLLLDETRMQEGNLNDRGVRNVKALSSVIQEQTLSYVFPFSTFEFETNLNILAMSSGRSILSFGCVAPVTSCESSETEPIDDGMLPQYRTYLENTRANVSAVPESISNRIQDDFVKQRKEAPEINQEDLLLQMTLARLVASSYGKSELDLEAWSMAKELDMERRKRLQA